MARRNEQGLTKAEVRLIEQIKAYKELTGSYPYATQIKGITKQRISAIVKELISMKVISAKRGSSAYQLNLIKKI